MKTPLKFSAVSKMSCMLRPRRSVIDCTQMALGRDYSLKELEVIPSTYEEPYLASGTFQNIQIFHAQTSGSMKHHVFCVLMEDVNEAVFFIVDPTRKKASSMNAELSSVQAEFSKSIKNLPEEQEIAYASLAVTQE